ncbi:MAG: GGDEF domain-containing protein [Sulfuritalea sp.]|nr:GGDEF domain-containing protein [Sulfuritalea sp.]
MTEFLDSGCDRAENLALKRKILHTNIAALVTVVSIVFYSVIYFASGDPALIRIALFELTFVPVALLVAWLNRQGRHFTASWLLQLTAIAAVVVSIHAGLGTLIDIHLYFVVFAVVPVMFFPRKRWGSSLFLFAFNTAIFVFYQSEPVAPLTSLQSLGPFWLQTLSISAAVVIIFTMLFLFWLADSVAETSEKRIEQMAMTDILTGLPNRRLFELVFRQEATKSVRNKEPLALVMLDIDHFKQVNDTWGHGVGDEVLKHFARVFGDVVRAGSFIARTGGEEFVLLLSNTQLSDAMDVAERVRQSIEQSEYRHKGQSLKITVSAGVTEVDPAQSVDDAYRRADAALYTAKNGGRNRIAIYGRPRLEAVATPERFQSAV